MATIELAVHDDIAEKYEEMCDNEETTEAQLRNQVERMILESYAQFDAE